MVKGIIHNIFFKYPFALLVFPLVLLSSPGVEIQVNQPGTLILSVHLDSVWIDENATIQSSPKLKSIVQPDQPLIPYISETLAGVSPGATLNYYPGDEKLIPISTELNWEPMNHPREWSYRITYLSHFNLRNTVNWQPSMGFQILKGGPALF